MKKCIMKLISFLVEEPESGNETRLEKGKVLLQTLYDDLGNR